MDPPFLGTAYLAMGRNVSSRSQGPLRGECFCRSEDGSKAGLIVNISFWPSQKLIGNVPYSLAKAATDKMTAYTAQELRAYNVAVVSLYPGLVKTESVMRAKDFLELSNAESPQFIGRTVAALASDPHVMKRSGTVCVAAA